MVFRYIHRHRFLSIGRNLAIKHRMYLGCTEKVRGTWHNAWVDLSHYFEFLEHVQISKCKSEEKEGWKHLAVKHPWNITLLFPSPAPPPNWCHSSLLKVHWTVHQVPSLSPQNATWEEQTTLPYWSDSKRTSPNTWECCFPAKERATRR